MLSLALLRNASFNFVIMVAAELISKNMFETNPDYFSDFQTLLLQADPWAIAPQQSLQDVTQWAWLMNAGLCFLVVEAELISKNLEQPILTFILTFKLPFPLSPADPQTITPWESPEGMLIL